MNYRRCSLSRIRGHCGGWSTQARANAPSVVVVDIVAMLQAFVRGMPNRVYGSGKAMNWEYRVEPISFADIAVASKALNGWGREGWETVAIIPQVGGQDATWTVAVLKKPAKTSK